MLTKFPEEYPSVGLLENPMENIQDQVHGEPTFNQGVRIDPSGRVLVPAAIRKALGITPGQMLQISLVGGSVRLQTVEAGLGRIWAIAESNCNSSGNVVDDFIAQRRRAAAKE